MEKSRKKFIKLPTLGGGRDLLKRFLSENMVYPPEAMQKGVEGDVIVEYRVNNMGEVIEAHVVHGIGHGCDEEALRLVRMLQYQEVRNRGVKVTTNNKIKIPFRLKKVKKQTGIRMHYVAGEKTSQKKKEPPASPEKTYTYTIQVGNKPF